MKPISLLANHHCSNIYIYICKSIVSLYPVIHHFNLPLLKKKKKINVLLKQSTSDKTNLCCSDNDNDGRNLKNTNILDKYIFIYGNNFINRQRQYKFIVYENL